MSQLLIEINSEENEAILVQLLPKLGARVISRSMPESQTDQSPVEILEKIAARGGAASFGDPSEWQLETRTDRILPGRDE